MRALRESESARQKGVGGEGAVERGVELGAVG